MGKNKDGLVSSGPNSGGVLVRRQYAPSVPLPLRPLTILRRKPRKPRKKQFGDNKMPEPQIERKFIPLSELKMSDEGPGFIEGYRAVLGRLIDRVTSSQGAFADSHVEYMRSGFSAESHVWNFKDAVGYPVEAREDDHGWWVKSEFHTTQGAQDVRTIARERMKAGKLVGFSFGYGTDAFQFIEQKDFKDQLPQFIKGDRLEENMKRAQKILAYSHPQESRFH